MDLVAKFSDKMELMNIETEKYWSGQGMFDKIGFFPLKGAHYSLHYSPQKGMVFTSNDDTSSRYSYCSL
jgi:hypothetical protein